MCPFQSAYLAVPIPVRTILVLAFLLVATLAVEEQHGEIDSDSTSGVSVRPTQAPRSNPRIKVRNRRIEPRGQAPGQPHQPVAEVIDMPRHPPPPRRHQPRSRRGLDVLDARHRGI